MFYHIIIELKNKATICELDIKTEEELISDYIYPYLNNEEFNFDGRDLIKEQITYLKIRESAHNSSTVREIVNRSAPKNVFLNHSCCSAIRNNANATDITKNIMKQVKSQLNEKSKAMTDDVSIDKTKVFIVHGHDGEARLEVAAFITALGFEPIVLQEQASGGSTIIEKIEKYSNVGFGIVLYTPCDVGGKTKDALFLRARQNVVFEHGYLVGKLGRKNVCPLVVGSIETPSDIGGVVYIPLDENGGWKSKLGKELRNAGYPVDMNKV